jgi:D-lactate dehydrogenase
MMLINTSRGAIINTKDAIEALKKAQIDIWVLMYEGEDTIFFKDLSDTVIKTTKSKD